MIEITFITIVSILAIEYFFYFPFTNSGNDLFVIMKKSLRVVTSRRISCHWKELVLIRYANEIFKSTACLFLILVGLIILVITCSLLLDWLVGQELTVENALSQPLNWIVMTLVAPIYIYFRKYYVKS